MKLSESDYEELAKVDINVRDNWATSCLKLARRINEIEEKLELLHDSKKETTR
jgi:hypothetical protein